MPRVVNTKPDNENTSSGTFIVELPEHEENDLILILAGGDNRNSVFTATAGWTKIDDITEEGTGLSTAGWWKVAGASEASPTLTAASGDCKWVSCVFVVKGFDNSSGNPIDSSRAASGGDADEPAPGLTTSTNDCLILQFLHGQYSSRTHVATNTSALFLSYSESDRSSLASYWSYEETAGVTGDVLWIDSYRSNKSFGTIAIKDDGSANRPEYIDPDVITNSLLSVGINMGGNTFPYGTDDQDADDHITTIDGKTVDPITTTWGNTSAIGVYPWFAGGTLNETNGTDGRLYGGTLKPTTPYDFSDGYFACIMQQYFPTSGYDKEQGGIVIAFLDSSDNWRAYTAAVTEGGLNLYTQKPIVVDLGSNTELLDSSGTLDVSDIDRVCLFLSHNYNSGMSFSSFTKVRTVVGAILGGNATTPATYKALNDIGPSNQHILFQNAGNQGFNQFVSFMPVKVGNGTDTVNFNANGSALSFGKKSVRSENFFQCAIDDNHFGLELYGVAGDTIKLPNSSVGSSHPFYFRIHVDSTASASWGFSSFLINGAGEVTLRDIGNVYGGLLITNSAQVGTNGADLTGGVTISSVKSGETASVEAVTSEADLLRLKNCMFNSNTNAPAIIITGNQSGTWATDPNLTMSGNTIDIKYTGTTDFTISSAVSLSVENTEAEAAGNTGLTIETPELAVTLTGLQTGTDVVILTAGTDTVLDSVDQTAGSTFAYVYSTQDAIDIGIIKAGFVTQYIYNFTPGATSANLPIKQLTDRNYV